MKLLSCSLLCRASNQVEKKKARGRALKHFLVHVFLHFLPPVEKKKARGRALKHIKYFIHAVVHFRRKEESPR